MLTQIWKGLCDFDCRGVGGMMGWYEAPGYFNYSV